MSVAERALDLCRAWRQRSARLTEAGGWWRCSVPGDLRLPGQGWKLHVSATILSAAEVFDRVFPVLRRRRLLFKVPATLADLQTLNSGLPHFAQVGKFLTVYIPDDGRAARMAAELDELTRGLPGPAVPFDARYARDGLVFYRYGAYRVASPRRPQADALIFDPRGIPEKDRRESGRAVPPWKPDVIRPRSSIAAEGARDPGPIGRRYLPFRSLSQRGKGGVYEALDLGSPRRCRVCVLKEGRRHGETQWHGVDGFDLIGHETAILGRLQRAGIPTPRILDRFTQADSSFLVLERLEGEPVLPRPPAGGHRVAWRALARLLAELEELLQGIHAAGVVWRDCKPGHLLRQDGRLHALDFEGACSIPQTDLPPWGSPAFTPWILRTRFDRLPGTLEDEFALGVLGFLGATGRLPPAAGAARDRMLRATGCPARLHRQILGRLEAGGGAPAVSAFTSPAPRAS